MIKGVDLSMLHELEKLGAKYKNEKGEIKDIFLILKEYGINAVRLRLWNHPYDENGFPYGGGTNDLLTTLIIANRIKKAGMKFFLNFHYSDFWTDPGKQIKPKLWKNFYGRRLEREVYYYTRWVLEQCRSADVLPEAVQIGNELTEGFLWEDGKVPNYSGLFSLLSAGIEAVRDISKEIKIIIHLDNGGNNKQYRKWFDAAEKYRLDFDIIGISYYPFWHGSLEDLDKNMRDIAERYEKDLLIAETSYGYTLEEIEGCNPVFSKELADVAGFAPSPEGQSDFMLSLMNCIANIPQNRGLGFLYWCPEWIPVSGSTWATEFGRKYIGDSSGGGNTWFNQALFDKGGKPLPALNTIKKF